MRIERKSQSDKSKILTGCETAELRRLSCSLVNLGKELSSGLQVGSPAEPASMTGIDVLDYTD